MGAAMAANLARAGFEVTGWNRTPGRAPELAELGVDDGRQPGRRRGRARTIVVICVSDTPDVEAVLFGPDGVAAGARAGTLVIDCSTIAPSGSWDFAARLKEHGLAMVDAPVSGGSEGAKNATLTIFVGGDEDDVERARPVLAALGKTITHVGPIGAGQAVKAVNQVILAGDLPRRGRGDRPRDQGRPRRRAGRRARSAAAPRRAGCWPTGAAGCSTTTTRSASRSRSTARISGSPSSWRTSSAPSCRSAPSPPSSRAGLIAAGHGDDDMSALARSIRALSALEG